MRIPKEFNIIGQCRKYNVPLWQCPPFLFLVMGFFICLTSIFLYLLGSQYIEDPREVALIVLTVSAILLVISTLITNTFEKLLQTNKLKSEFIDIVSHHLRAPISNLEWTLDFLLSRNGDKLEKDLFDYLKILKENSGRIRDLLNDLLIISKIEGEKMDLKKERFSLEALIKETIKNIEEKYKSFNIRVRLNIYNNVPEILGDRYYLKEVFSNLLQNAFCYSKENSEIKITLKKEKKFIYCEIEDKGIGIPKEDQPFIFQKFFRASNVLKYKPSGTGLGLYIAKLIVERLKGKIGFFSQEGVGSTFWFKIPIQ